ncbi:hypothetical protein [Pelagerythrobacter marensis]|uniref:Flagellar assembly protein FliH/Type III secretion system HrpE domain-containing protein n=1 Tax=Pelagerythrobacter marensis TaxID=543877 RepID=A0A0G3X9U0_9SPHN|nr:hypothetical protein [Pelagerythrobacter marensis]AKM07967.1 hypothetical protein AM2010_1905 [Pelagerythrobacter marensis]
MISILKHGDRRHQNAIEPFTGSIPRLQRASEDAGPIANDSSDPSHLQPNVVQVTGENSAAGRTAFEQEIERLRQQIEDMEASVERQIAEAFDNGRDAGLAEAREGDNKRLALLEQALHRARQDFNCKTADVEALAIIIARAVLARIFGDDTLDARRIEATVAHRLEQIDPAEVRAVRVSASDFPDASELERIAGRFPDLIVHRDRNLAAGESLIELDLGRIDPSPVRQWEKADAHLATLAEGGGQIR